MKTSVYFWRSLLPFLALVLCLTACKEDDSGTDDQLPPSVPVSQDDWQDVSATGGTIEKGDIALTFPAGTFSGSEKVAITNVKQGSMLGEHEASPFYQITMPCTAGKPTTIRMKSEKRDDEVSFVAYTTAYCMSAGKEMKAELTYTATYSNGEYVAKIPAIDGDVEGENVTFTIGLAKTDDQPAESRTRGWVAEDLQTGKVKNITYIVRFPLWTRLSSSSSILSQARSKSKDIADYAKQAINKILDLGFKIEGEKTLYIDFVNDTDWGGQQCCGVPGESGWSMWVSLGMQKMFDSKTTETDIKCTVVHEIFHWFQAFYDPRSNYKKSKKGYSGGEPLMMSEMGAVWSENLLNGGQLNFKWLNEDVLFDLVIDDRMGLTDIKSRMNNNYAEQGYSMGPLLYYLCTSGECNAFGFTNKSVVELHERWGKELSFSSTLDIMDRWVSSTHDYQSFFTSDVIDDYYLMLLRGELVKGTHLFPLYEKYGNQKNIHLCKNAADPIKLKGGNLYPYGCTVRGLHLLGLKSDTLTNCELVIKQKNKDVQTYVLSAPKGSDKYKLENNTKGGYAKATIKDSIVIKGSTLESLRKNDGTFDHYFFFITTRQSNSTSASGTIPFEVTAELRKPKENKKPHVEPTSLKFPPEGGTQNVKTVLGNYTRAGYSISKEGNGWVTVSFTSSSHGMDITVTENKTGKPRSCIVNCHMTSSKSDNPSASEYETFPIAITQEAGELEPGVIIMDAVSKCELTANAQMKHRKKGTTSQQQYKNTFDKGITFTQDGSTLHVEAAYSYKEGQYDNYQGVLSFDIVNFEDNFTTSKLENVTYQYVYSNNYVDWTQPGVYGKGDEVKLEVSNVSWQKGVSKYVNGGSSHFVFSGSVSNGVYFKSLTEKRVNLTDEETTENFDYVENKNNSFMLIIDFKANGTATSRLAAPWQSATEPAAAETITWQ